LLDPSQFLLIVHLIAKSTSGVEDLVAVEAEAEAELEAAGGFNDQGENVKKEYY
jgi:hypothetical protein